MTNFNVVKTACLLIEILELISIQFEQLSIRCKSIRVRIEDKVQKYLALVNTEAEMTIALAAYFLVELLLHSWVEREMEQDPVEHRRRRIH